jgi:hypothetical protein
MYEDLEAKISEASGILHHLGAKTAIKQRSRQFITRLK